MERVKNNFQIENKNLKVEVEKQELALTDAALRQSELLAQIHILTDNTASSHKQIESKLE